MYLRQTNEAFYSIHNVFFVIVALADRFGHGV